MYDATKLPRVPSERAKSADAAASGGQSEGAQALAAAAVNAPPVAPYPGKRLALQGRRYYVDDKQ